MLLVHFVVVLYIQFTSRNTIEKLRSTSYTSASHTVLFTRASYMVGLEGQLRQLQDIASCAQPLTSFNPLVIPTTNGRRYLSILSSLYEIPIAMLNRSHHSLRALSRNGRALGVRIDSPLSQQTVRRKSGPYGYTQAKALVFSKNGEPSDVLQWASTRSAIGNEGESQADNDQGCTHFPSRPRFRPSPSCCGLLRLPLTLRI